MTEESIDLKINQWKSSILKNREKIIIKRINKISGNNGTVSKVLKYMLLESKKKMIKDKCRKNILKNRGPKTTFDEGHGNYKFKELCRTLIKIELKRQQCPGTS